MKFLNKVPPGKEKYIIGIYSMLGWTTTKRYGVTRKRSTKIFKHTGNLYKEEPTIKSDLLILDLQPIITS